MRRGKRIAKNVFVRSLSAAHSSPRGRNQLDGLNSERARLCLASFAPMPPPVAGRFLVLLHLLDLLRQGVHFLSGLGRCLLCSLRGRLGAFSCLLCAARRRQRLIGRTLRFFHIVFRRTTGQQKRQADNRQYCGTTQEIHLGFSPLLCCPQHVTRCQCQRQCIRAQKACGSDIFWSLARQQ